MHVSCLSANGTKHTLYDTLSPLQRQRRVTYQPWLKAKEIGPPKILTGLKARNITSRCRSIPNMFRAFSPLACFESQPLALQARLVCIAPSALRRPHALAIGAPDVPCPRHRRSGRPMPSPSALGRTHALAIGAREDPCPRLRRSGRPMPSPSALRRTHAVRLWRSRGRVPFAVGALEDACRWPLAVLSDHRKEMAPLGAPSASSAFFCRLPRPRSGEPMFRALAMKTPGQPIFRGRRPSGPANSMVPYRSAVSTALIRIRARAQQATCATVTPRPATLVYWRRCTRTLILSRRKPWLPSWSLWH